MKLLILLMRWHFMWCKCLGSLSIVGIFQLILGNGHCIRCSPIGYISFSRPAFPYCAEYIYICIYIYIYIQTHTPISTVYRPHMKYRCYQIALQWNIFTQIGTDAKCWLDMFHWGAGLCLTGRIRDIGQKVLQSSFQTGSCARYFHIFPYRIHWRGFY